MATYVTPKKNTEWIGYVALTSQADVKLVQTNPTLAAGDVKVSTDGGALNNATTLPAVTPAGSKAVKVTLSASEMNGDNVVVIFSDAAGAEWCDLVLSIQTTARQIDDLAYPTVSGRSLDVSAGGEAGVDWANVGTPGSTVSLSATTIATVTTTTTASALTTNNDKTGYRLSATGVDDVWDEALSGHTTAGTAGLALAEAGSNTIQKNTALANFMFPMYDSTTKEPKTGLVVASITKYESIDGAAPVALTGAITEVNATNMPGIYAISLTAGETNGRVISLRFAATGCDSTIYTLVTND
jgi:hypothetical protein